MVNPFQIYGPFEIAKPKQIYDNEYHNNFWSVCEKMHPQLSEAKGLYLFSLKNRSNFTPAYVGITSKQTFRKEVFSFKNKVMILGPLSTEWGVLCIHLLAKPKESQEGFSSNISIKTLFWTENFLIQLCAKKNPNLQNVIGSQFIKTTAIESITVNSSSKGMLPAHSKTFRNALGIEDL
jgi:hypothetical protein